LVDCCKKIKCNTWCDTSKINNLQRLKKLQIIIKNYTITFLKERKIIYASLLKKSLSKIVTITYIKQQALPLPLIYLQLAAKKLIKTFLIIAKNS